MKYNQKGLGFIINELKKNTIIEKSRFNKKDFSRKRKIGPKEIIEYNLNKKGLSSKMEKYNFLRITNYEDISSPGLLKQREKLKGKKNKKNTTSYNSSIDINRMCKQI